MDAQRQPPFVVQDRDASDALLEQINQAIQSARPLRIQGANSKAFLGRQEGAGTLANGNVLDTRSHCGIVTYDPTELVITARAGTPLSVLNAALEEAGQMLPCEPPSYRQGDADHGGAGDSGAGDATVGGMVAAGLSGPRRPWSGSVRDFVLGTRVITGLGKHLRFGGEVMKNVAGYDLSRLMAGSFGCLGLITEVSLKVLPKPRLCTSIALEMDSATALARLAQWGQEPLPISAASHDGRVLRLRLEGGEGSVAAAHDRLGGEAIDPSYWRALNEHRLDFFADGRPLWRLSLPVSTTALELPGDQLIDWAGAQRWLKSDASGSEIRRIVSAAGGHATCYSHGHDDSPFQPLATPLLRYHRQLKAQLDPHGVFNPGRMYAEI